MMHRDAASVHGVGQWTGLALLGVLLAVLAAHVGAVALDIMTAIRYPFELGYAEGIVWQQAALIPGPRMYGTSQDLPFIVFNYPPLYYLLARAALSLQPDLLAAGRFVSALSTVLIAAPSAAGLVLIATRGRGQPIGAIEVGCAMAAGMLVLCLPTVRSYGAMMRPDILATSLGMMGLLVGAWSNGRFWGTAGALLLCVAAVFAKQTHLSAGVAVFLIALLRNPRGALGAAALAGGVGLAAVGWLELLTGHGFLRNIIDYNITPFSAWHAYRIFKGSRASYPFIALMLVAFVVLGWAVLPSAARLRPGAVLQDMRALRGADRATACRALLLLRFALATLMLPTAFKDGSNYNYLLECLSTGCVLIGVLLVDLARGGTGSARWFQGVTVVLLVGVALLPMRQMPDLMAKEAPAQAALVERIAAAQKPVSSENMVLLMRAGKPVIYEPRMAEQMAVAGTWDEAPLVEMIRAHGFAFMITTDFQMNGTRRTPTVEAAMMEAYPRVEQAGPRLWLRLPPGDDQP